MGEETCLFFVPSYSVCVILIRTCVNFYVRNSGSPASPKGEAGLQAPEDGRGPITSAPGLSTQCVVGDGARGRCPTRGFVARRQFVPALFQLRKCRCSLFPEKTPFLALFGRFARFHKFYPSFMASADPSSPNAALSPRRGGCCSSTEAQRRVDTVAPPQPSAPTHAGPSSPPQWGGGCWPERLAGGLGGVGQGAGGRRSEPWPRRSGMCLRGQASRKPQTLLLAREGGLAGGRGSGGGGDSSSGSLREGGPPSGCWQVVRPRSEVTLGEAFGSTESDILCLVQKERECVFVRVHAHPCVDTHTLTAPELDPKLVEGSQAEKLSLFPSCWSLSQLLVKAQEGGEQL